MDADGLPFVGPGVDYTKVRPLHQKSTLSFLNQFLSRTTTFLNHFATVCDEKLEDLLLRIQRLESSMAILESKLSSIPGLECVPPPPPAALTEPPSQPEPLPEQPPTQQPTVNNAAVVAPTTEPPADTASPLPVSRPISKDPRFAKYFKMLSYGIAEGAVRQKMMTDGVDPDILNDPNREAPPGGEVESPSDEDSD